MNRGVTLTGEVLMGIRFAVLALAAGINGAVVARTTPAALPPHPPVRVVRPMTDDCAIKRTALHRPQTERPATLPAGASWPAGWREVTRAVRAATRADSMAAESMGIRAPTGGVPSPFPRQWAAFVVDTSGSVHPCSVAIHDAPLADAPLARQLVRLRFTPATVAGRTVDQVILLERVRTRAGS